MEKIRVGLGWKSQGIDLDGSVIMFDGNGNNVDYASFDNKVSIDGAIIHSGDIKSGSGSGDIEAININLKKVS